MSSTNQPTHDLEAEAVDLNLREAMDALNRARVLAEVVGYGDQFRGDLADAIKQTEYVRRLLK